MNRRLLGNILISILIILLTSGILMYFLSFEKRIASIHTVFGLFFTIAMVLHIVNNKKPLSNYIKGNRVFKLKKFQSLFVFSIFSIITLGLYNDLPILNNLYKWGNQIRNAQIKKSEITFDYQIIDLSNTTDNKRISIELKKGNAFQYPLFAVWLEDIQGNYIETIYLSRVIASSTFDYGEKINDQWKSAIVRRPESLPYWSHRRGIKASDGLYMPLNNAADLDGVSGATPTNNFIINTSSQLNTNLNYRILLELNQSYDWNEFYTENKFPNDKVYSGSGQVGQPSLIYAANINNIDFNSSKHQLMHLIGHGHHSGINGTLYKALENITTAKQIADRIIINIQ